MRRIGLWMTVALLIAPFDAAAGDELKEWYLMEPPVDNTSNVGYGFWIRRA